MTLNIHNKIYDRLDQFIIKKNIPHIIFYGPNGSGKQTILNDFINKLYNNDIQKIHKYTMFVNCAHGKGIKFIREELKFFAKSNIQHNKCVFKSIILLNADNLTIDAQSALRRCIEQYSHTTRFFIIVYDKFKLLNPILSRFCNIYIPLPKINDKYINLHEYNKKTILNKSYIKSRKEWLINNIHNKTNYINIKKCNLFVNKLYEKGYSGLNLLDIIENMDNLNKNKYMLLMYFDKIRVELRNEKLYMLYILYFTFMRKNITLKNIINM